MHLPAYEMLRPFALPESSAGWQCSAREVMCFVMFLSRSPVHHVCAHTQHAVVTQLYSLMQ